MGKKLLLTFGLLLLVACIGFWRRPLSYYDESMYLRDTLAGVENREMVEALGFRVRRLFVGVFIAGTALAGIGGVMWAVYQELVTTAIGADMTILMFIVVIIGGLGSVSGCFVGAMLVGLTANYTGFLAPKLALGSSIALMVLILLWRPRGLLPVAK